MSLEVAKAATHWKNVSLTLDLNLQTHGWEAALL